MKFEDKGKGGVVGALGILTFALFFIDGGVTYGTRDGTRG